MVSRREGEISMEALDSVLFPIPGLVDYRASFDGTLTIEARALPMGQEAAIAQAVRGRYPGCPVRVSVSECQQSHRSMYPGKRYVMQDSANLL